MRKKVDQRIQILIENCIKLRQRGFFIILGDRGHHQIVNLHYQLVKQQFKAKPRVLWCYKKDLGFSSHKKKRMKQIQALQKKGVYDTNVDDPFELFITSTDIRYCYYKETHKILGQTYQLLILQDFEALTPNTICRTMECVEGGGFVILLLNTMKSLKQLYTISMDVHDRFRSEQFQDVDPRFNERFILSLSQCKNAIVMDDELNILPISSLINDIKQESAENSLDNKMNAELINLKEQLKSSELIGPLVNIAKTLDQAKAIMTMVDAVSERSLRYTISITAARGRGKSASVGISIAGAIASGFSNIFVTAPSPENLTALFEFVFEGLEALGYKENMHYDIIKSTNPDFNSSVIRVNVYKTHRQIIQYILPVDYGVIGQADLLVIDEAAAIPLVYVKKLLGPYLVFLSSTINGYEGTGRSLSLKLINQLRDQNRIIASNDQNSNRQSSGGRMLKEVQLLDPIRYSSNDPLEKWINDLLLLEATEAVPLKQGMPHPNDCELYLINRDTLFSYKKMTEQYLYSLMSLFISSHYKNSPNDLQLLSDSQAQAIFVLSHKIEKSETKSSLPDVLCVIQVALEGKISLQTVKSKQERSVKPAGDLIPWTITEQFQDPEFAQLCGARVIRIATHPAAQKMGYGTKALELLSKFFEGKLINLDENSNELQPFLEQNYHNQVQNNDENKKKVLKPLLRRLIEVQPPQLHYLGVSYGISQQLFRFWKKSGYEPLYLRQTRNDITAEHSCIMVKQFQQGNIPWLQQCTNDFKRRFISLLSYEFKELELYLCLGILDPYLTTNDAKDMNQEEQTIQDEINLQINNNENVESQNSKNYIKTRNQLEMFIDINDHKRIQAYSKNMVDYHLIIDLLPLITRLFFEGRLEGVRMSRSQCTILIGMGLQHKDVDKISKELSMQVPQILALFNKAIRKLNNYFKQIYEKDIEQKIDSKIKNKNQFNNMMPTKQTLEEDVKNDGEQFIKDLQNRQLGNLSDNLNVKRKAGRYNFEIDDIDDKLVEKALQNQKNPDKVIIERNVDKAYNQDFYLNKNNTKKKIKK